MSGAWRADWPEENTGMISQPLCGAGNMGVRHSRADAIDARIVFAEFVAQSVDVDVIDAREAPEFLIGDEAHAGGVRAAEHAPSVAMAVNGDLRVAAQRCERGQADAVYADHDAGSTVGDDQIVAAQHLVELACHVGRIHQRACRFSARILQ